MCSYRHRLWQCFHASCQFFCRNVPGRRAHRHLCCNGLLVQLNWKREINRISGLLQKALRLVIHALNLALFDAQDAKWLAQFIEVSGLRSQDNDLSAWRQNALKLRGVARGEDN